MPWYVYAPSTLPGDPCDPNNYILVGLIPPVCPNPNLRLCAIQTGDSGGSPVISFAFCAEIKAAIDSKTETVNVLLKP